MSINRRDPLANTSIVLVPHVQHADGTLTRLPMWASEGAIPTPGIMSTRRGLDDAFSSGSLGFTFTGSFLVGDVRHTFSGNAVEPGTKGLGHARPKAAVKAAGKASAASRYMLADDDDAGE